MVARVRQHAGEKFAAERGRDDMGEFEA